MTVDQMTIPNACLVYGTNMANYRRSKLLSGRVGYDAARCQVDLDRRVVTAVDLISSGVNTVISVGGQTYDPLKPDLGTEANVIDGAMRQLHHDLNIGTRPVFLTQPRGLETVEQTQLAIQILRDLGLIDEPIGVVSSWHQIPRARLVLSDAGIPSFGYPADKLRLNRSIISGLLINLIAGYGYTALALRMQQQGVWSDGGPIIHHYRSCR